MFIDTRDNSQVDFTSDIKYVDVSDNYVWFLKRGLDTHSSNLKISITPGYSSVMHKGVKQLKPMDFPSCPEVVES